MGKGQTIEKTKELKKGTLRYWIENYRWMVESIEEARQPVSKTSNNSYIGAKIAQYGIESTLPKASGFTGDPVYSEVNRRLYYNNKTIKQYEDKIAIVQSLIPFVKGDRENEVLHRLLNGDSMAAIGKHMKLSKSTIFRIRESILDQMLSAYETFGTNGTIETNETHFGN